MDKKLLDILVCPLCNGKLRYIEQPEQLVCSFDRLSYPFDEGIPVMLADKATSLTAEAVEALKQQSQA